jgi:hypothetical protein
MLDGARNALLGFLYQLLGTASVRVREVAPSNDGWADLIARVGNAVIRCEEFGQDATARPVAFPNDGVVAIQFKYSGEGNAIERGELLDILFAFDRSRRDAAAEGVAIDRFCLVTNRTMDANAQQVVDQSRNSPEPPGALRLRRTRSGQPIAENVRRLAPYNDDPDAAASALHAILREFDVLPCATFESDLCRLRAFAARYGVLNQEWNDRLNALIGAFVRETGEGRVIEVTREWLKRHLVGNADAANIQFDSSHQPHISVACRKRLDDLVAIQHRIPQGCFVPRDTQQAIRDQLALHPIVFVYGDGGCGKSLAVAEYLRAVCDRQLVWSEPADTASEMGIVEAINRLRMPGFCTGNADSSLSAIRERLQVANQHARPTWTINLDGIDETPNRRTEIRHLINQCWAQGSSENSPASLIVTCRSSEADQRARIHLASEWIGTPEPDLVTGVGFVSVGEFLDQDLAHAAELLNGVSGQRILDALNFNANDGKYSGPPGRASIAFDFPSALGAESRLSDRRSDTEPIAAEILQALRHPVVWGGFASLSENERIGILDGDQASLGRLADLFVKRFIIRCRARKKWSDCSLLEKALCTASRSITKSPPFSPQDWESACCQFLSTAEARDLYSEGLTYGLVRRESGPGWRWGHRFVIDYLAGLCNLGAV